MMERIQQKIDGQEISMPPEEAAESKVVDLMEALKASVDGCGKRKPAKRASKRAASGQAQSNASPKRAKAGAKPRNRRNG